MQSQEVKIKPNVKVVMKSDAEQLDEVMVVAYGTAKKSSFTGSATSIKADQITSGSKESLDKAFSGKMAGVRVASATGDPGSVGKVNIRGVGSINGSTAPLYVIDGKHSKKCTFYTLRFGCSFAAVNTIKPQLL